MTRQILIRSSPVSLIRRKPLLDGDQTPATTPTPSSSSNVGEFAGGTAAECFVVCCCCPCALLEFLFLVVYRVPATFYGRIWRKRRHKMMMMKKKRKGLLQQAAAAAEGSSVSESHHYTGYCDELSDVDLREFEKVKVSIDGSIELDNMMWDQFQNMGFWRSSSQRHS